MPISRLRLDLCLLSEHNYEFCSLLSSERDCAKKTNQIEIDVEAGQKELKNDNGELPNEKNETCTLLMDICKHSL